MRTAINDFLGYEFIPACAIGNEMACINGNLVIKTFHREEMHGYRKLALDGEVVNIITELKMS